MSLLEYIKVKISFLKFEPEPVFMHEPFSRDETELAELEQWKSSSECEQLLSYLYQEYRLSKMNEEDTEMIHFFGTPTSKGFKLRYPEKMPAENFQYLLDYLKDLTVEAGYKLNASGRKHYKHGDHSKSVEKYHLKPDARDAHFNDISIELHRTGDKLKYIKYYGICQPQFRPLVNQAFERLISYICSQKEKN